MSPAAADAKSALPCFWCSGPSDGAPPEHVIPEALGAPKGAVLPDVCDSCNHGVLAGLDQALVVSLDIVRWQAGVPNKKGERGNLATRSNFFSEPGEEGPVAHINMGPGEVKLPNGRVLKAPTKSPSSVHARIRVLGKEAEIDARAMMLHHPDCSRALHKIAIESIALTVGREMALDPSITRDGTSCMVASRAWYCISRAPTTEPTGTLCEHPSRDPTASQSTSYYAASSLQ